MALRTKSEIETPDAVECGGRMVVVVPERLDNMVGFARMVYARASAQQRQTVLYLALTTGRTDELAAARQLATLTALTQGSLVQAGALQMPLDDWQDELGRLTRPGDLLLFTDARWLVSAGLEHSLGLTQQVLPGFAEDPSGGWTDRLARFLEQPRVRAVLLWLSGLVILIGFSYLEFSLGRLFSGAGLKFALALAFAAELYLLYRWNAIFR